MKLSCDRCNKVYVVRNTDVKAFQIGDFLCPDCKTPLKKIKNVGNFRVAFTSVKNLVTSDAFANGITQKIEKLYQQLQTARMNSLNFTIN